MLWYCQKGCGVRPVSATWSSSSFCDAAMKRMDQTTNQLKSTQRKRNWFPIVTAQVWLTSLGLILIPGFHHNSFVLDWCDTETIEEKFVRARSSQFFAILRLGQAFIGVGACSVI